MDDKKQPLITTEGKLFRKVQTNRLLPDSKTFVDSTPLRDPKKILEDFENSNIEDLQNFIRANFEIPEHNDLIIEDENLEMVEYIQEMWSVLTRHSHEAVSPHNSLIPLKYSYIVPGGRFREMYYWDTYFTLVGLAADGQLDLIESVVKNFGDLIRQYGFIPTANRTYYLTRSQPPLFVLMLELLEEHGQTELVEDMIPLLEKEYSYWMDRETPRRCVEVAETPMNRYYDDKATPRPESYIEDVETAENSGNNPGKTYRDLKAAAESGWDFSTRWLENGKDLSTINTTDILPVDLNAIVYHIESKLAEWTGKDVYRRNAERRKEKINELFWNEEKGFYFDYNWRKKEQTETWSLAGVVPLFFGLASDSQAGQVAEHLEGKFLKKGGLATTLTESGEQWDSPNGWAPLHWFAVNGLLNYDKLELAQEIAERWVKTNSQNYSQTGHMMEKYNVEKTEEHAEDGEYTLQRGFGWTNGVITAFLENDLVFDNSGKLDTARLREQF